MASFRDAFSWELGSVVEEVIVGAGPCGELRMPSYLEANGWRFPGTGEFQCFDRRALASLAQAAREAGHPEWGTSGPHDAGEYNSSPEQTGFFSSNGSWNTDYGRCGGACGRCCGGDESVGRERDGVADGSAGMWGAARRQPRAAPPHGPCLKAGCGCTARCSVPGAAASRASGGRGSGSPARGSRGVAEGRARFPQVLPVLVLGLAAAARRAAAQHSQPGVRGEAARRRARACGERGVRPSGEHQAQQPERLRCGALHWAAELRRLGVALTNRSVATRRASCRGCWAATQRPAPRLCRTASPPPRCSTASATGSSRCR
jgi:hypothetical protein